MKRAFTLIELLIVVAIIAILAAIAVPNFLEAQVRAKVSRAKSDMRTLVTGAESYAVDYSSYPADIPLTRLVSGGSFTTADSYAPNCLSTPIAYLTTARFVDPFVVQGQPGWPGPNPAFAEYYKTLFYQETARSVQAAQGQVVPEYVSPPGGDPAVANYQAIKSAGGWSPFFQEIYGGYKLGSLGPNEDYEGGRNAYDPTNGTLSSGDIYRTQREAEGNVE